MAGEEAGVRTAPAPPPGEQPPAPRSDSITRNTFFGLATQLTTAAFTAALTLFLVRALGPDDYGIFALATGICLTDPSERLPVYRTWIAGGVVYVNPVPVDPAATP